MNALTPEQIAAAGKANLETLFGLTTKAFEGVEKLIELNMQVARATLAETQDTARAALSAKDAQELLALQAGLLQPAAEKAAAYSRHLYEIAATTGAEMTRAAEAQMVEMQRNFMSAVEAASKNAPAGTEGAVNLMKSAMTSASTAYENVQRAAQQATAVMEQNFNAVTNNAVKASQQATRAAKR